MGMCLSRESEHRPRLLCIHGHRSNSDVTKLQLANLGIYNLRAPYESPCRCTFLDGPYSVEAFDELIEDGRTWHQSGQGLGKALHMIVRHVEEFGPYDGAYAFSQGTCLLTMLSDSATWQRYGGCPHRQPWRFLILGCGTDHLFGEPDAPTVQAPLLIPSLHIMGRTDDILPFSHSLCSRFDSPLVCMHDYGHAMPMTLGDGSPANELILQHVRSFCTQHGAQVR